MTGTPIGHCAERGASPHIGYDRSTARAAARSHDVMPCNGSISTSTPASNTKVEARRWSPLVQIRRGRSAPAFFCVHGAGGNVLNFRAFSQHLRLEHAVFGLEARGVDGDLPPATSVAEMADLYLDAIRRQQSHGPYVVGGYSGGGVVALEIARRAAQAGERATEVVLFDTFHPHMGPREVGWRDHYEGIAADGIAYVFRMAKGKIVRHATESLQAARLRYHLKRGATVPHDLRELHVSQAFIAALRSHVPTQYTGNVTLFRASETARVYDHAGLRLGWEPDILPSLDVVVVPGGHHSLVDEPNVRLLAAGLDRVLRRGAVLD